jgi:hypothetical protein
MKSNSSFVLSAIVCLLPSIAAQAQQKVPGEAWRHTVSMEAAGFSMPARTTEMCAPVGKAEEAMARQQPGECAISNMKQAGNKVSYDFRCTGKSPIDGHFESERTGDTMRGSMTGTAEGTSMKMKFEATKLGKACEALDYSNYKPPVAAAAVPLMDACQAIGDKMDPNNLASVGSALLGQYPSADGKSFTGCKQHAAFQKYCSAVQTPAGYASLESQEWTFRDQKATSGENEQARMARAPLTESIHACGLGTDAAAVPALQKRMVEAAKKDNKWGFALYYASAQEYPAAKEIAKKECSGRSFTNAANKQYAGLCANYGAALARDDRSGVLQAAGCSQEREDTVRGICVGAKSTGSGSVAKIGGESGAAAGAAGAVAMPTEASAEEAAKKTAAEKGNSALDKGKKALKGLFGH